MKPSHLKTPRTMGEGIWLDGGAAIEKPYVERLGFWDVVMLLAAACIMAGAVWIFFWLMGGAA
jgi:hypothetical protein